MNHRHGSPIGKVTSGPGGVLVMELIPGQELTEDQMFATFGNFGYRVLEEIERDGVRLIRKAEILEFSLPPEGE